jgi:hypothetical protein
MKIHGQDAEDLKAVWTAGVSLTMQEKQYQKLGYSAKRHRWDIFWNGVRCNQTKAKEVTDRIYKYANDTHIDTLFKQWQEALETGK